MKLCCGCVVQKDASEWGIADPCDYHNPLPLIEQLAAERTLLSLARLALVYHQQQTRPIQDTIDMIERINAALAGDKP